MLKGNVIICIPEFAIKECSCDIGTYLFFMPNAPFSADTFRVILQKRGNHLLSVPLLEAFALPNPVEQTTLEPTPI
jgi:hypothetical protein